MIIYKLFSSDRGQLVFSTLEYLTVKRLYHRMKEEKDEVDTFFNYVLVEYEV